MSNYLDKLTANAQANIDRPLEPGDRVVDMVDGGGEGTVVGPDPNPNYKGSIVVRFDRSRREERVLKFAVRRLEPTEHSPSE